MKCKICLTYLYEYILCYILSFIWIVAGDRFVDFHSLNFDGNAHTGLLLWPFLQLDLEHNVWQMGNCESSYVSPPEKNTDWPKWTVLKYDGSVLALFSCLCFSESDIAMYLRIKEKLITFLSWIRFYTAGPNQQTTLQRWAGLIQIQPMIVSI